MKKTCLVLVGWLCTHGIAFAAVPHDFDGDGISDRTYVEIESDKSLTWSAHLSTTGETRLLGSLGKLGDVNVMAQWLPGGTQIGVASLNEATGLITWSIKNGEGAVVTKSLGQRGDLVVSGADFNGNGTADAAVVRLNGAKVEWHIVYDLFSDQASEEQTVLFGRNGDRVFFARPAADPSKDWIGYVRRGSRTKSLARMMNLATSAVAQHSRLPKFASVGVRPRAFPIRQAEGEDLLGFSTVSGGRTSVKVFSFAGTAISSVMLDGSSSVVVGEYLQNSGFEIAHQNGEDATFFNPLDIDLTEGTGVGGILVDEINISPLGVSASATPTPAPGGGGNEDSSGGGGIPAQCGQVLPWPQGYIYKTIGSNHFTDVRRNTIGVILRPGARGPYPSCVEALDSDGRMVAKLGLWARGNGWEARYYAGIGCANSTPYGGAAVASRARAKSGSSRIYMKFANVCYGPIEASRCIGSNHC